jgi:hypothetical protein
VGLGANLPAPLNEVNAAPFDRLFSLVMFTGFCSDAMFTGCYSDARRSPLAFGRTVIS